MTPRTQAPDLPERFAAQGQEFIASLLAQYRFGAGKFWINRNGKWRRSSADEVSRGLRVNFEASTSETAMIRRALVKLSEGIRDPAWQESINLSKLTKGQKMIYVGEDIAFFGTRLGKFSRKMKIADFNAYLRKHCPSKGQLAGGGIGHVVLS